MADAIITGYEVIRFGVPMIYGEYVNTGRGRNNAINSVVPGTQYRITAWALGTRDGRRSVAPAVVYVTTREASECGRHVYNISGLF